MTDFIVVRQPQAPMSGVVFAKLDVDQCSSGALELLRSVMKATALKIPALHEKPELLQTTIEGSMLSDLIDEAVTEQVEVIRSRQGDAELNRKIIKALEQVDGKMIVQNMSPEFLCFFTDCYKEMRY